jgi:hypothetical protein
MNEFEFQMWRKPATQKELFPKAWAYKRQRESDAAHFTCEICGCRVHVRDADPSFDAVCIGCSPTLF